MSSEKSVERAPNWSPMKIDIQGQKRGKRPDKAGGEEQVGVLP